RDDRSIVPCLQMLFTRLWLVLFPFLFAVPWLSGSHVPSIFAGIRRSQGVRYYPTVENPPTANPSWEMPLSVAASAPQYCVANSVLNFTGMGLRRIGDSFINTTYARELYLDGNDIKEISETAFDSMKGLEILSISGNNLPTNKLLWFHYHETLWRLTIDDNVDDTSMNDGSVQGMLEHFPRLEYLSLRRNGISRVDVQFDKLAPVLNWLDLSGNRLESFDFVVDLPRTMKNLYLEDNDCSCTINKLPSGIEYLQVSGNRITELCNENCSHASLSLRGLKKLKILTVSRNNVRYLDLSHNQIIEVMNLCDNILTSIETLNLSNNYISMIDNNFVNMLYLRTLDLSNNRIAILPTMLIFNSRSLEVLLLRNNSIEDIDDLFKKNSFKELELHLQDNPFSAVKYSNFQVHLKDRDTRSELTNRVSIESFGEIDDIDDVDDTDDVSQSNVQSTFEHWFVRLPFIHWRSKLDIFGNILQSEEAFSNEL
ncbi:unnamed protein product, partial [Heterotrigona itama]